MRFLFCIGFVIEDVDVAVTDLNEVNVTGDEVAIEVERESPAPVVAEVIVGEINGDLHSDRHGIVDEHEALQGFMAHLVGR